MRLYISVPFLLLMCISSVAAHGDLDLRIQAVTSAIQSFPDSAQLYFKRGKLRFQHEEYQESVEDFNLSISKGYSDELHHIYLAKSFYKLQNFEAAHKNLQAYLEQDPNNVVGLNLKGRILYAEQDYEASAHYFEKVIDLTIRSLPENYLEAVQSWNASENPDKFEKVVDILTLGLENLGSVVTLQNKLIETYLQNNSSEKAIELQLSIIDKSQRKESAYFKLAEIYLQFDENENANEALLNAKSHLEDLPRRIRKNAAMKMLEQNIEQLIKPLK